MPASKWSPDTVRSISFTVSITHLIQLVADCFIPGKRKTVPISDAEELETEVVLGIEEDSEDEAI